MTEDKVVAAILVRKSNDENDRSEDVKSIAVQTALCRELAQSRGWTVDEHFVFADDGISGVEYRLRPGLQALLAATRVPVPPFQRLIVTEQSRIGRDTVRTLAVIQELEEAGVEIWAAVGGRRITLTDDTGEIMTMLGSWRDTSERRQTVVRVRNAAFNRHEGGYVTGGKVYGYQQERLPGTGKQPVRRTVDEQQAGIVRRIFNETAAGRGLQKIAKQLNAEGIPGPRAHWSPTGVREVLHRELYRGDVIFGRVRRDRKRDHKVRVRVPASEWKHRQDDTLRIVTDALWTEAHAASAASAAAYLRRDGKLQGQVENLKGRYLLSGFLACGVDAVGARKHGGTVCGEPLLAVKRGNSKNYHAYVCRGHRDMGDSYCTNASAVPMDSIHTAVLGSLRTSFSPEAFERHLATTAADEGARAARGAERSALLARIPVLAAEAERLANAIAAGAGTLDVLLAGIKARTAEREAAEARVVELEGTERDLRADGEAVERLRATWITWAGALNADPATSRQLLRKILAGVPIYVRPEGEGAGRVWIYAGVGRFDGLLHGKVTENVIVRYFTHPPIAVGSDLPVCSPVRDSSRPPM